MAAKYSSGTKVRIKGVGRYRNPYLDIWQYENMTGEILDSTSVIGYIVRTGTVDSTTSTQILQAYKIHLDTGIEVNYVIEEYLEEVKES